MVQSSVPPPAPADCFHKRQTVSETDDLASFDDRLDLCAYVGFQRRQSIFDKKKLKIDLLNLSSLNPLILV